MKKVMIMLMVGALVSIPLYAKNNIPGAVAKPGTPTVDVVDGGDVTIDWEPTASSPPPETTAVKWSVDIEGVVTYSDGIAPDPNMVSVEVSLGTSTYPDPVGGMAESKLTISEADLLLIIKQATTEFR